MYNRNYVNIIEVKCNVVNFICDVYSDNKIE